MSGLILKEKNTYIINKSGQMKVDCIIYLKPELLVHLEDEAINQLKNAACLPGVYKYVLGMPDIHTGYGLPIGGVLPVLYDEGVVSAGAVGMDINCGVRILTTNITKKELQKNRLEKLIQTIQEIIPAGVGQNSKYQLQSHLQNIVEQGVPYLKKLGLASDEDLNKIEENGFLAGADLNSCSKEAQNRMNQLSTLGGGNHFIEISEVDTIFDEKTANYFGLYKNQIVVMIHSGSRGFGHQICQDYSREMAAEAKTFEINLPSKGLACAPIKSSLGKRYLSAMACAVNFAFANRQLMTVDIRRAFAKVFNSKQENVQLNLLYDVAHNIAKKETHFDKELLIHRKGATRALPSGHMGNPKIYLKTGHPVLLPGSMGTHSYIATGSAKAKETFYSVNHGAGRVLSRKSAKKSISKEDFSNKMSGIYYNLKYNKVVDEAPQAYKDIHLVVNTLSEIDIINKVANIKPLGVIKGED